MTCTPKAVLTLGLALALAAGGASAAGGDVPLDRARAALAINDGIAAEARLREALKVGVAPDTVRALMGEALLAQGDLAHAREWLTGGAFTPDSRAEGFRMLGRLELRERNLPAAGRAFDQALQSAPRDARLWADIGRLRFAGGEQREAIEAADHALALAPQEPAALALRAILIRSQYGLTASLPWFEAALAKAPDDPALLAEHAATLGDMGRAGAMLEAVRRLHKIAPTDPHVFYLQAVLAARAGKDKLARRILYRSKQTLRDVPGAILLAGVLELRAGNREVAVTQLDRLLRLQPDNLHAQRLLARALATSGDAAGVIARFGVLAQRADAPPYLLTLVARSHEELGERDRAVALLARATRSSRAGLHALPVDVPVGVLALRHADAPGRAETTVPWVRALLRDGRADEALQASTVLRNANPGAPDAHLMVGDSALAAGRSELALAAYQAAARIRFGETETLRLDATLRALGREREANTVLLAQALQNPNALLPARMLANAEGRARRWERSAELLGWLGTRGGWRDPALLADLAFARLQEGEDGEARKLAAQAFALQPANPSAGQIRSMSLAAAR